MLAAALLAGCTSGPPAASPEDGPTEEPTPVVASDQQVHRLLAQRARALAAGRRADFTQTTAPGPGRRDQLRSFDVLGQLPVGDVSYVVSSVRKVGDSDVTRVATLQLVRLDGFDPRPVAATHLLDLVEGPSGWHVERDRLAPSGLIASPWALPGARVRTADGLAVVLDEQSGQQADRLLRLLEEARAATETWVPYDLTRDVLVVAPSTAAPLRDAGFQPVEIQRTGAIVTSVTDRSGGFVASRMVLVPASLREDDATLLNVLRHELAHLAVGRRDSDLPLWIVEGLAEWASWRGVVEVRIATTAVTAARTGEGITAMPPDLDFRSPDSGTAYGVAWYAMTWLEQQYGPEAPYALLQALTEADATGDREVSRVLDEKYGVTTDELAQRSGDLIDATFE